MKQNTQKLTKDFCSGKNLVFLPTSAQEAELVQKALLNMGFRWNGGYNGVLFLKECVEGGMMLLDNNIGYNIRHDDDNLLCTLDQFEMYDVFADNKVLASLFNTLAARVDDLRDQNLDLEERLQRLTTGDTVIRDIPKTGEKLNIS